jgi:hypothetical protein
LFFGQKNLFLASGNNVKTQKDFKIPRIPVLTNSLHPKSDSFHLCHSKIRLKLVVLELADRKKPLRQKNKRRVTQNFLTTDNSQVYIPFGVG